MVYDRNSRDYYGRREVQDYGRDYGSGRQGGYSSARDYAAAGWGRDDDRQGRSDDRYGRADYGNQDYSRGYDDRNYGRDRGYGRDEGYGARRYSEQAYGQSYGAQQDRGQARYARGDEFHGSYASDGRRFEDVGQRRHWDDDDRRDDRGGRQYGAGREQGYGRQPQGYDYQDRGFFARAGDEVRSWFGDDDAERRREADNRYDERYYANQGRRDHDDHYHSWRSGQIAALDRDYDEYREENRSRFENEFSSWRSNRQTQRDSLGRVNEHDEVLGSDGAHVGTVDKVRGDRILLTKNDADAGGQHHSIPSRWIQSVADKKVTLSKTAEEAKAHWRDEEGKQALFGYGDRTQESGAQYSQQRQGGSSEATGRDDDRTTLNRSFSGTY